MLGMSGDMVVHHQYHLDEIKTHHGNTPLGMNVMVFPEDFTKKGRCRLNMGCTISCKSKWGPAFLHPSLLPRCRHNVTTASQSWIMPPLTWPQNYKQNTPFLLKLPLDRFTEARDRSKGFLGWHPRDPNTIWKFLSVGQNKYSQHNSTVTLVILNRILQCWWVAWGNPYTIECVSLSLISTSRV